MLFTILFYSIFIIPIITIILAIFSDSYIFGFIGTILSAIPLLVVINTWSAHANDLAVLDEQKRIIIVYTEQRNNLKETLNSFDFPKNSMFSVNMDNPVSAITKELANTESKLTLAKEKLAEAHKNIASTRRGPMSDVIEFVDSE